MKRLPVHNLDPTGGSSGQVPVISGGKFVLGSAGMDLEAVRDAIGAALVAGTGVTITVNDGADTITIAVDTTSEAERIRDVIGAALVAGTGITVTVNDAGDTITIASTVTSGLDAEGVRDTIAAALVEGSGIDITVNDGADTITIAATGGGGGSLTVQDENSNVSTSVSQIDFQGAGVTASSGTGEVVVTIPGASGPSVGALLYIFTAAI